MMREILFRGKRKDNGEWETGSLVMIRQEVFITDKMTGFRNPVSPDTVGQYIGLTDKNGQKIYDGDIIESHYGDKHLDERVIETIVWDENGWCVQQNKRDEYYPVVMTEYGVLKNSVVIGNVHDNPEL